MSKDKGDKPTQGAEAQAPQAVEAAAPETRSVYVVRGMRKRAKSGKKDSNGDPILYKPYHVFIFREGETSPVFEDTAPKTTALLDALAEDPTLLARLRNVASKAPRSAVRESTAWETVAEE